VDEVMGPGAEPLTATAPAATGPSPATRAAAGGGPLFDSLRQWRRQRAAADGVPAYVVFHDATLAQIAERKPRTLADLRSVSGVGPSKLERYGKDVLEVVAAGG
jgi:ATP-dependent DNA helicase RecQ